MNHVFPGILGAIASAVLMACSVPARDISPETECLRLGASPGSEVLERCIAAPDSNSRTLIMDAETYGTF
jgi:hypothetical protein